MNEEAFEAVLGSLFPDALSECVTEIAGQSVRVEREVNNMYGFTTITVTRLDTGAVYKNIGEFVTKDGRWVDTNYSGWERT
jgi:hypothetical protein